MTDFRTGQQLFDYLDRQLAWRQRELFELTSSVQKAEGRNVNIHVRSAVAILYAHWEGFIKDTANSYVNYLSHRADRNDCLIPAIFALSMRSKFGQASGSSRSKVVVPMVKFLIDNMAEPTDLPRAKAISAESNLDSAVFENIAGWIGIDTNEYSTRYPIIDDVLLPSRNSIAHGEYSIMSRERYLSLADEVIFLIRIFKRDIENSVATESFLLAGKLDPAAHEAHA